MKLPGNKMRIVKRSCLPPRNTHKAIIKSHNSSPQDSVVYNQVQIGMRSIQRASNTDDPDPTCSP